MNKPDIKRIDKQFQAEVSTLGKGMFAVRVTTEGIDRDAEVVVPDGMDASNWLKGGSILWNHNADRPVAKPLTIHRDKGGWVSVGEFAKRPDDYQGDFFPDFARAMVEQGIVRSASVGVLPKPGGRRFATKGDKSQYGEGVQTVISKWELIEWSFVPVPSNPEAIVQAVGKSGVSTESVRKWLDIDIDDAPPVTEPIRKRRVCIVVPAPRRPTKQTDYQSIIRKEIARARGTLRV